MTRSVATRRALTRGVFARRVFARGLVAASLAAALVPVGGALATAKVDLVDIEDEVMCVVCERPLSTSGGEAADDQRAVIQRLIDQGLTKQRIKDELVDEYGERVLVQDGSPVAGAAPILAALVGAGSIVVLLRRRRRPRSEDAAEQPAPAGSRDEVAPELSDADEARIDAELSER